eukprot:TRINITY_DN1537_c0_g3_i1.p1 TRINITY_DN1537_c0_g3~~TRINITY_DN1537_c0_g3_i1.p1  ORF type:complete len:113 (-),score=11.38 TRINITY_DN1537_c0_g3_i1:41-379(-)
MFFVQAFRRIFLSIFFDKIIVRVLWYGRSTWGDFHQHWWVQRHLQDLHSWDHLGQIQGFLPLQAFPNHHARLSWGYQVFRFRSVFQTREGFLLSFVGFFFFLSDQEEVKELK